MIFATPIYRITASELENLFQRLANVMREMHNPPEGPASWQVVEHDTNVPNATPTMIAAYNPLRRGIIFAASSAATFSWSFNSGITNAGGFLQQPQSGLVILNWPMHKALCCHEVWANSAGAGINVHVIELIQNNPIPEVEE